MENNNAKPRCEYNSTYINMYSYSDNPDDVSKSKLQDGPEIIYNLNSYGFRSKEFDTIKNDTISVLYGGCSVTFGSSMFEEFMWSNILTSKIGTTDSYNISYAGASIFSIVKNTMAFIRKYGKPNYLFICFPSITRNLYFNEEQDQFLNCFVFPYTNPTKFEKKYIENFVIENSVLYSVEFIHMLESFCQESGIKLFWTTWNEDDDKIYSDINFKSYIKIKENNLINDSDIPYWDIAKDMSHPGSKWNIGLANQFYDAVKLDLNNEVWYY